MTNEIWKEVEIRGTRLLVSNLANVKCPEKRTEFTAVRLGKVMHGAQVFKEKVIRPCLTQGGYMCIATVHKRKRFRELLHRLVGIAFVPGYQPGLCINHLNGIKTDNRPENLEWVSLEQNTAHAWKTGLVDLTGGKHPSAILTSKRVVYIRRLLAKGISAHAISVVAGVSDSLICKIRDRERWASVK